MRRTKRYCGNEMKMNRLQTILMTGIVAVVWIMCGAVSAGEVAELYGGASPEVGEIYHVDGANGSDSNDGLTAETAFATIQKGIDTAGVGDTVLVWPAITTATAGSVFGISRYSAMDGCLNCAGRCLQAVRGTTGCRRCPAVRAGMLSRMRPQGLRLQ